MYYVTMVDKFLSGWGKAEGKIAQFINECKTYEESLIVADNARNRSDQKNVKILTKKPSYNENSYHVEYKTKKDMPNWYKAGYFRKHKLNN